MINVCTKWRGRHDKALNHAQNCPLPGGEIDYGNWGIRRDKGTTQQWMSRTCPCPVPSQSLRRRAWELDCLNCDVGNPDNKFSYKLSGLWAGLTSLWLLRVPCQIQPWHGYPSHLLYCSHNTVVFIAIPTFGNNCMDQLKSRTTKQHTLATNNNVPNGNGTLAINNTGYAQMSFIAGDSIGWTLNQECHSIPRIHGNHSGSGYDGQDRS